MKRNEAFSGITVVAGRIAPQVINRLGREKKKASVEAFVYVVAH